MKRLAGRFLLIFATLAMTAAPIHWVAGPLALGPNVVLADSSVTCADGSIQPVLTSPTDSCSAHGGVQSAAATPAASNGDCVNLSVQVKTGQNQVCPGGSGNVIITYLVLILQFAGSAVGGIIVLMLIIAGVQYITAAGDPGAVKAAKNRIINAITALVLFMFMFAILNFLIPGGIFT